MHLAPALVAQGHEVRAIGSPTAKPMPGIELSRYKLARGTGKDVYPLAVRYEADCIRGAASAQVADRMRADGFTPDFIFGHLGWGETLFLPDIWPDARSAIYAEFNTRAHGLDVGFDPEFGEIDLPKAMRARAKGGSVLLALLQAEHGLAPMQFQADTFPADLRAKIAVCHDGVETQEACPQPQGRLDIPGKDLTFRPGDPVITYINRNLEPLRGLHIFLRALPHIQRARPDAQFVVIGDHNPSPYGSPPPAGTSWKDHYLKSLQGQIDLSRVHFLGRVPRRTYLDALAVSAAHIYLTYPFVLSWSLLEAMSVGCLVIGSDTAPVREAITHERNGLLVDFFDVEGLAARAVDALNTPERYRALREQARADTIARYDLKTVCLPKLLSLTHTWTERR